MAQKVRVKQYIINASKHSAYEYKKDHTVLNLNACFNKKANYLRFLSVLKEIDTEIVDLNLCNLASYCYKFEMRYDSDETKEFVEKITELIKNETPFRIKQDNILNCGEIDCRPIEKLVYLDRNNELLFTNSVLLDCLKVLGYVDCQLGDVVNLTKNLNLVVPPDLAAQLPIKTTKTEQFYNEIKQILVE